MCKKLIRTLQLAHPNIHLFIHTCIHTYIGYADLVYVPAWSLWKCQWHTSPRRRLLRPRIWPSILIFIGSNCNSTNIHIYYWVTYIHTYIYSYTTLYADKYTLHSRFKRIFICIYNLFHTTYSKICINTYIHTLKENRYLYGLNFCVPERQADEENWNAVDKP